MESKDTNSLKSKSITRIKTDMIEETIRQSRKGFLIIILDDYSSKILGSFLTMSHLLNMGIFSIERLSTKRQPFPRYQALYFIEPTQYSLQLIAKDFEDKDHPMYSRLNVFFTHRIEDDALEILAEKHLVCRTLQCRELNLSFLIKDKNLFDLGFDSNMKIFVMSKTEQVFYLIAVKERFITAMLAMNEFPYVQYQKNSIGGLCEKLAEMINSELKEVYGKKERKGILLITDRSIDACAPFQHDYNWEPLVRDMYNGSINSNNELILNGNAKTKGRLDDSDELWDTYRHKHLVQVFDQLAEDFNDFMKSDLSKVGKNKEMDKMEDMSNALKNMTNYQEKNMQFSFHLALAEDVNKKYREMKYGDLVNYEQDVISGVDDNGEIIEMKELYKRFNALKGNIGKREDFIRLLGTLLTSLDITEQDFNSLSGSLSSREAAMFKCLDYLGISFSKTKVKDKYARRTGKVEKAYRKEVKQRMTQIEYKVVRSNVKLVGIVEQCSMKNLGRNDFAFIEEPKNGISASPIKKRPIGGNLFGDDNDNDDDRPVLFLFVLGGISYTEISALQNLNKTGGLNHRLVIGSTGLLTANSYMLDMETVAEGYNSFNAEKSLDATDVKIQLNKP